MSGPGHCVYALIYNSADVTVSKSYKQLCLFIGTVGVFNVCELCNAASVLDNSGIIPTYPVI